MTPSVGSGVLYFLCDTASADIPGTYIGLLQGALMLLGLWPCFPLGPQLGWADS